MTDQEHTTDTIQRVARILGWRNVSGMASYPVWRDSLDNAPLKRAERRADRPYDVDDLRVWLESNAATWLIEPVWSHTRLVRVGWRTSHPGVPFTYEDAPTILGALEQAVIAVAERGEQ